MHPADQGPDIVHILFYGLSVIGGLAATAVGFIWKNHLRHNRTALVEIGKKIDKMEKRNREDHKEFFGRLGDLERDVGILMNRK